MTHALGTQLLPTRHGVVRRAQIQTIPYYAQVLRQKLQPFWMRVPDPDEGLLADYDLYEEVRQDPVVTHALEYLALLVAGAEWDIVAAEGDPRSAALVPYCKAALDHLHDFVQVRKFLTDAILMGVAVGHKVRSEPRLMRLGPDKVKRWWRLVEAVQPVDKRRLEIERERDWQAEDEVPAPRHYWKIWDPFKLAWWVIEDREQIPQARIALQDFVWHFSESREDRVGYGRGILEILYTTIRIKSYLTQYRAAYCEKFASPWLIARIDTAKRVTSAALATGDIHTIGATVTEWMDLLTQMQARHVAVADKDDEIEVVEPAGTATGHIAEFMDYLDRCMTTLILGATLSTQQASGPSSSWSQSRVHEASTDAVVAYHRARLQETLRDDLLRAFIADNHEIFAAMGLADVEAPIIRLHDDRRLTPEVAAQMIQIASDLGLPLSQEDVAENLHVKLALPGQVRVRPPQPAAPAQGPFGNGGGGGEPKGGPDPDGPDFADEERPTPTAQAAGPSLRDLTQLYAQATAVGDRATLALVQKHLRRALAAEPEKTPNPILAIA